MGLLSATLVKPLLIALAVSNVGWWLYARSQDFRLDVVQAGNDSAVAALKATTTERDAWKGRANELAVANIAFDKTVDHLKVELATAQGERRRLLEEGQQAIAKAQAEAAEADRTLKNFVDRYANQIRNPDCAGALAVVQQACPALEGY